MDKPVIKTSHYSKSSESLAGSNNYKGYQIHSLVGLHGHIATLLESEVEAKNEVLELGCGTGALSLRLSDLGFTVSCSDYVRNNFKLPESFDFFELDLNTVFEDQFDRKFDIIIASELVEHLENPRNLIRNCAALLNENGLLVITTPNITTPASIASMIYDDSFRWFDETSYEKDGHIRPVSRWELVKILIENGLKISVNGSFGEYNFGWRSRPRMFLLTKMIAYLTRVKSELLGEIVVIVAQK